MQRILPGKDITYLVQVFPLFVGVSYEQFLKDKYITQNNSKEKLCTYSGLKLDTFDSHLNYFKLKSGTSLQMVIASSVQPEKIPTHKKKEEIYTPDPSIRDNEFDYERYLFERYVEQGHSKMAIAKVLDKSIHKLNRDIKTYKFIRPEQPVIKDVTFPKRES